VNLTALDKGGFTDTQVALLQTFAEQAVIAITSAETYRALQARTEELARSLDDLRRTQDRLVQTEKLASLGQLTADMVAMGVPRIAWLKEPVPLRTLTVSAAVDQQADAARHEALHGVIDAIAAGGPAVKVIDLAGWVSAQPFATDPAARPDSVHWTTEVATQIAEQFLGQALVQAALS
jgi:hypothetical protein